jgi:hypothetical protein
MSESISVMNGDYVALVSVQKMCFMNVFNNITSNNNTFKILSTWKKNTGSGYDHEIRTITIPPSNYSIEQLFDYINPLSGSLSTYYYGLGTAGDSTKPPFEIAASDITKMQYTPPDVTLLTYNAAHDYTGFYILIDKTDTVSINYLERIGVIEYDANGNIPGLLTISDPASSTQQYGLGFPVAWNGSAYVYTNTSTTVCSDCINITGPLSINVMWDGIAANTRNSYNNLSSSNCIAVVPVDSAVGFETIYTPNNPYKAIVPALSLSTFQLSILDSSDGTELDFQGVDWLICLHIEFKEIDNAPQDGNFMFAQHARQKRKLA